MYCLCVALPELPLEVFQPSEQPVVVVEQQRVLLCNTAATARGIDAGLNVSTALALAGDVLLAERDTNKEQQRLNELAELAYQFSSQVVTYQNRRGDYCLLLEIGASLRLFNGAQGLLKQLGAQLANNPLHPNGFTHRFGLANTLKAAELMARSQPQPQPLQGPSEQVRSKQGTPRQKADLKKSAPKKIHPLARIPVALLDCEAVAIAQCEDLGLVWLGDVLALPPATLAKRFNASFTRYLEQLQGQRADPQNWYQPASHFNRELFYIDGLCSHADLQHPMQQLLRAFCLYLQQRQLSCTSIRWTFTRFSKKKHSLRVHLSRAQANYHNLFELSALQLGQLPLDSPVECVALHCQQLIPVEQQHLDLFAVPDNSGDFCLLADKLTGKLGKEVLWQPTRHDQHLPEQANASQLFNPQQLRKKPGRAAHKITRQKALQKNTPKNIKKSGHSANKQHNDDTLQQPSWLLREPLPLEQRGETIFLQGKKLSLLKGPQRLHSNWWSQLVCRDYFIAALACPVANNTAGKVHSDYRDQRYKKPQQAQAKPSLDTAVRQWAGFYWVYYDALAKRWYLHGEFA